MSSKNAPHVRRRAGRREWAPIHEINIAICGALSTASAFAAHMHATTRPVILMRCTLLVVIPQPKRGRARLAAWPAVWVVLATSLATPTRASRGRNALVATPECVKSKASWQRSRGRDAVRAGRLEHLSLRACEPASSERVARRAPRTELRKHAAIACAAFMPDRGTAR